MESEYSFSTGIRKAAKNSKIPGEIMVIMGIALITYYVFDTITVFGGFRAPYLDDIASTSRIVVGIVAVLGGMFAWKWDDIGTSMP